MDKHEGAAKTEEEIIITKGLELIKEQLISYAEYLLKDIKRLARKDLTQEANLEEYWSVGNLSPRLGSLTKSNCSSSQGLEEITRYCQNKLTPLMLTNTRFREAVNKLATLAKILEPLANVPLKNSPGFIQWNEPAEEMMTSFQKVYLAEKTKLEKYRDSYWLRIAKFTTGSLIACTGVLAPVVYYGLWRTEGTKKIKKIDRVLDDIKKRLYTIDENNLSQPK